MRRAVPLCVTLLVFATAAHGVEMEEEPPQPAADPLMDPVLSVDEPMYFVVGGSDDIKARFQLSLKYRVFDVDGRLGSRLPWLQRMYFGYTQTSLWNLEEESAPFEDSSYKPSLFQKVAGSDDPLLPAEWRYGVVHESNGQAGETSRSMNRAFVRPVWRVQAFDRPLELAPVVRVYLNRASENRDIADFRGHVDYVVRYGSETGMVGELMYRRGRERRSTWQLDLSYPIRQRMFANAGGYVYLQLFEGYGESLLTYNQKSDLQVRLGIAIAR